MGGRGGYGGGHGGGYGGGRSEGGRGGGESPEAREQLQQQFEAQRTLLIVQRDNELNVTDNEGRVVTLKADGSKVMEERAGTTIERRTKWDGRTLVTEVKLAGGVKATQTYTKVDEGLQLVVTTKVEGGRLPKPVEFKRVYDQALEGS
jgi:hypothetical protein